MLATVLLPGSAIGRHRSSRSSGARKRTQLQDNLASLDLALSADQLTTLDEASRVEMGFPHDFHIRDSVRTVVYGSMQDLISV